MQNPIRRVIAVLCFCSICAVALAEGEKKPAFKPTDVEIHLRDGTVVRGELRGVDSVTLKTAYGPLTFPVGNLVVIQPGVRSGGREVDAITAALRDLDADDFAKRTEAQKKLETIGVRAIEQLKTARQSASTEVRTRIDTILKKLTATQQGKLRSEDSVRADDFEADGIIQTKAFRLAHRLGELEVEIGEVESIRWLAKGEIKRADLEPEDALANWKDTGVDAIAGEQMLIVAAGTINLFQNTNITPLGATNWGNQGPLPIGAVVGKIGASGKPFLIGSRKQFVPTERERLYVKIHCTDDVLRSNAGRTSPGKFKVVAATGARIDDLKSSDASFGGADGYNE